MKRYHVEIEFVEDLLGTVPKNKDIYQDFVRSKAPEGTATEDELETVEEIESRGWTGFHMEDGKPILYNYAIKGFFKDACSMLSRVSGKKEKGKERIAKNHSSALTAFKKIIDGLVFIEPRKIPIIVSGDIGLNVRPLRVSTPKGERVSLTQSDTCPAGSKIEFDIVVLGEVSEALLREWLDYGRFRGIGQWRNASWGSFQYVMTPQ
jgi:hypothetical protein